MNKIIECLINKKSTCIPIWFMRQAGRHLPEFRKIRFKNPDFIKLCLNSALSTKITLQPIERYDLDAAIIFSDILMVPYALGQEVIFKKNKSPKLSEFNLKTFLNNDKITFSKKLYPIYKAIKESKKKLKKKQSLISFVGAPWTILIYMLSLKNNDNKLQLDKLKKNSFETSLILDKLNDYLSTHIENQINAGADVVQIFDSWAGLIPEKELYNYCYIPNLKIVDFCKSLKIPTICFPKGIGKRYKEFLEIVKPDGLSIDYDLDPYWARSNLENVCLQGGLDPKTLLKKEKIIYKEVDKYLTIFKKTPYIFNLGHGLLPETNPDVLRKVIERVRKA